MVAVFRTMLPITLPLSTFGFPRFFVAFFGLPAFPLHTQQSVMTLPVYWHHWSQPQPHLRSCSQLCGIVAIHLWMYMFLVCRSVNVECFQYFMTQMCCHQSQSACCGSNSDFVTNKGDKTLCTYRNRLQEHHTQLVTSMETSSPRMHQSFRVMFTL